MSLDNALRSALVHAGDAIPAEASRALPGIVSRARAQRRRHALKGVSTALVIAVVVWAPPAVRSVTDHDNRQPPAREERIDRRETPEREPHRRSGFGGRAPTSPSRDGGDAKRRLQKDRGTVSRGQSAPRRAPAGDTPITEPTTGVAPRRLVERYEVAYVAGNHLSENAGGGCWQGTSATGSNDCISIRIGPDESAISFRLTDDEGVLVGATVYQHTGGEDGTELVSFCGATNGYVAVEPDALLLVYIETSARCSDERPHFGTFVASIR